MSVLGVQVIESSSLSAAWGEALLVAEAVTAARTAPMVVSVAGFEGELPPENPVIRGTLDDMLKRTDKNAVRVSAMTIFPWEVWVRRGRPSCNELCTLCVDRLAPRMKARDVRNRLGIYFERMMAFEGRKAHETRVVNQLQYVIDLLNRDRRPRRSALQLACFDPAKDHTGQPVRGFPCLQQVSITHDGDSGLGIHAFYPTQYIFDRAYGNYLGLCHLGGFIAHQTGMRFSRLNCFIGWPVLGDVRRADIAELVGVVRKELMADTAQGAPA